MARCRQLGRLGPLAFGERMSLRVELRSRQCPLGSIWWQTVHHLQNVALPPTGLVSGFLGEFHDPGSRRNPSPLLPHPAPPPARHTTVRGPSSWTAISSADNSCLHRKWNNTGSVASRIGPGHQRSRLREDLHQPGSDRIVPTVGVAVARQPPHVRQQHRLRNPHALEDPPSRGAGPARHFERLGIARRDAIVGADVDDHGRAIRAAHEEVWGMPALTRTVVPVQQNGWEAICTTARSKSMSTR